MDMSLLLALEQNDRGWKRAISRESQQKLMGIKYRYYRALESGITAVREQLDSDELALLLADNVDKTLLAAYRTYPNVYQQIGWRKIMRDFRTAKAVRLDQDMLLDEVGQLGTYNEFKTSDASYNITLKKYGKAFAMSWECGMNDDLDALRDQPTRAGNSAAYNRGYRFTAAYAANATLFANSHSDASAGTASDNTGTAAFAIDTEANLYTSRNNLISAIDTMGTFRSPKGDVIDNSPLYLVVGTPGMLAKANVIVNGRAPGEAVGNGLQGFGLQVVRDPYIPLINTTNGTTAWYLFADPARLASVCYAVLAGHEEPQIYIKDSDSRAIGGGEISPLEGDFNSDAIWYKVRDEFDAVALDWRGSYYSTGTG